LNFNQSIFFMSCRSHTCKLFFMPWRSYTCKLLLSTKFINTNQKEAQINFTNFALTLQGPGSHVQGLIYIFLLSSLFSHPVMGCHPVTEILCPRISEFSSSPGLLDLSTLYSCPFWPAFSSFVFQWPDSGFSVLTKVFSSTKGCFLLSMSIRNLFVI
jgi:hypothetical protein